MNRSKNDLQTLTVAQWMDRVDGLGLNGPLEAYRRLLEDAPDHIRESSDYRWVEGFVAARALVEEMGGQS